MDSLPTEAQVAEALLALLRSRNPSRLTPAQAYQMLATEFGLSQVARDLETSEGRSAWENRVRYARWALIKAGSLDGSEPGVWQLPQISAPPDPDHDPTSDPEELDRRVTRIRQRGVVERPEGRQAPKSIPSDATVYLRDPRVKAWVLQVAAGQCELCRADGPFLLPTGDPYLEVHHVLPLAAGGPDIVENVVAVCPNCHRRLHLGVDADQQRDLLYSQVERLVRAYRKDYEVPNYVQRPDDAD